MDRCFFYRRLFLFHPTSPVASQDSTFILHAYRTYHSISTLFVSLFCVSGWLSRKILWVTRCFSVQLFEGYLTEIQSEETFWKYYYPQQKCFCLPLEKHIVGCFVFLSAAFRSTSSMDGLIHSIMEGYDAKGKSECPG